MRASDVAYEALKADIIDGILEPGAPLGEMETAERVGVSRTPIREAFARLAAEGLVTSERRTVYVAPLNVPHVIELYELREALETQAARLAARRRDPEPFGALVDKFLAGPAEGDLDARRPFYLAAELDDLILEAAGSRYISAAVQDLRGQMARIRQHARHNPNRLAKATEEHMLIAQAIRDGDEVLAVQATAVHLRNSLQSVLAALRASPAGGAGAPG